MHKIQNNNSGGNNSQQETVLCIDKLADVLGLNLSSQFEELLIIFKQSSTKPFLFKISYVCIPTT